MYFHEFKIDIPEGNRGVYIVDFVGNAKSCRTIIRRGALRYITRDANDSTSVFILDENNEICKSERTGLMLGKDYYKADPSDGKIKIDYSEGYHNQAVLM